MSEKPLYGIRFSAEGLQGHHMTSLQGHHKRDFPLKLILEIGVVDRANNESRPPRCDVLQKQYIQSCMV